MSDQAQALRALLQKQSDNRDKTMKQPVISDKDKLDKPIKSTQVYAVSSGKGGVGKTNLTLNLAIALQQRGKNVLIIDTDFGFANIDILCGLVPQYTIEDVLCQTVTLEDVMLTGPAGVKLIPGGNKLLNLQEVNKDAHDYLRTQFSLLKDIDIIFIDTGAGITKTLMSYVVFAQELLLIVTPEPTSLTDAFSFLKVIDQYQLKRNVNFIINRVENKSEGDHTMALMNEMINRYLSVSTNCLGYVSEDRYVSSAVKKQTPFVLQYPTGKASLDVKKITDKLVKESHSSKSMPDIFSRLLRIFT